MIETVKNETKFCFSSPEPADFHLCQPHIIWTAAAIVAASWVSNSRQWPMPRPHDDHPVPDILCLPNDAMTSDDYCHTEHEDDAKLKMPSVVVEVEHGDDDSEFDVVWDPPTWVYRVIAERVYWMCQYPI